MMKNSLRMALLALCVFMWLPGQAYGQSIGDCTAHEQALESLAQRYNEHVMGRATIFNGNRLEVLTSPHGETWSVLVIRPDGIACLVSAGDDWRTIPLPIPGQDS